jgi:isochorismate synthase
MMMLEKTSVISLESLDCLPQQNFERAMASFYQAAVDLQLPVALWRYPQSDERQALVDFNGLARPTKIDFTTSRPGFAFSPFVNDDGTATLFIQADLHLQQTGHTFYNHDSPFGNPLENNNKTRFLNLYQQLFESNTRIGQSWIASQTQPHLCSKTEYCGLVTAAIEYIKSTGIKKVVTSRATETLLPPTFNPLNTFDALCQRYPHAFVSLVSIPTVGTWSGVSPELLLRVKDNKVETVALAGTQPRQSSTPLSAVQWGAKEIEEQALVSDYIRYFLQRTQPDHFSEVGPHTVSAGQIVHLQTKFKVKLAEPHLSQLANQILHELHPTSAVCGMPKKEALSFILEKENYERAFYSGFLGPVHLNQQSHLFVNLRCMQLKQHSAILYVGGGITKDSAPQAEWTETVLKSRTLLNVLQPEVV